MCIGVEIEFIVIVADGKWPLLRCSSGWFTRYCVLLQGRGRVHAAAQYLKHYGRFAGSRDRRRLLKLRLVAALAFCSPMLVVCGFTLFENLAGLFASIRCQSITAIQLLRPGFWSLRCRVWFFRFGIGAGGSLQAVFLAAESRWWLGYRWQRPLLCLVLEGFVQRTRLIAVSARLMWRAWACVRLFNVRDRADGVMLSTSILLQALARLARGTGLHSGGVDRDRQDRRLPGGRCPRFSFSGLSRAWFIDSGQWHVVSALCGDLLSRAEPKEC
nr:hypothetical protein Iba_chr08eCG5070 [Ipomoea batatas]